jgi:ribosome-binding ATPase YchF (GTP1/OBG family)
VNVSSGKEILLTYKMDAKLILSQLEAIETLLPQTTNETLRKSLQDEYKKLNDAYTQLVAKKKEQPPSQPKYIVTEQTKSKNIKKEKYQPGNEPHISDIEQGHMYSFSIKPKPEELPVFNGLNLSIKEELVYVANKLLDKIFNNEQTNEEISEIIYNKCYVQTKTVVNFIRDIPGQLIRNAPREFRHTGYRNINDLVQNVEDLQSIRETIIGRSI